MIIISAHVVVVCGFGNTCIAFTLAFNVVTIRPWTPHRWLVRSDYNPASMCIHTSTLMWLHGIWLQSDHQKCSVMPNVNWVYDCNLQAWMKEKKSLSPVLVWINSYCIVISKGKSALSDLHLVQGRLWVVLCQRLMKKIQFTKCET